MADVSLITGPVRSGKSSMALDMALKYQGTRYFLATAVAIDDEMLLRINNHKAERTGKFQTVECPYDLADALSSINGKADVAVVDCLTVWLGNMFFKYESNYEAVMQCVRKLSESVLNLDYDVVLVTNEVGWGIVPENAMSRLFRDISGYLNRIIAARADKVYLCVCGIPKIIKGTE